MRSRDDIGKSGAKTLLQHFRAIYGPEDSIGFKRAQRAFACSQAAYAVVCYLLQIKVFCYAVYIYILPRSDIYRYNRTVTMAIWL